MMKTIPIVVVLLLLIIILIIPTSSNAAPISHPSRHHSHILIEHTFCHIHCQIYIYIQDIQQTPLSKATYNQYICQKEEKLYIAVGTVSTLSSQNVPSTNNCQFNPFPVYNKAIQDKMLHNKVLFLCPVPGCSTYNKCVH